jgi:hypothetical protein
MADPERRVPDREQAESRGTDPALRPRAEEGAARRAALQRQAAKANAWRPHEAGETGREAR